MNKFWTITAINTEYCNDRSTRHYTFEKAVSAAQERLARNPELPIIIMEARAVVKSKPIERPIIVEDITNETR